MTFLREPESHTRSQAAFAGIALRDWMTLPNGFNGQTRMLCGKSGLAAMTDNRAKVQLASEMLDTFDFVGLFDDIEKSLDLLSLTLKLPPLKLPSQKLNPSGAVMTPDEFGADILRLSDCDVPLMEQARRKFDAEFSQAFGDAAHAADARKEKIETAYEAAVTERLVPHWTVELAADCAWPAMGMPLRESNQHGQAWRDLSGGCTVFAKLFPGADYVLSLQIHSASVEAMQDIAVAANGIALERINGDGGWHNPSLNWLLPASSIDGSGLVRLAFGACRHGPLSVAALRIYPGTSAISSGAFYALIGSVRGIMSRNGPLHSRLRQARASGRRVMSRRP